MTGTVWAGHRRNIPFRAVNLPGLPGYDAEMQRHHLLPRQLLGKPCFEPLLRVIGCDTIGYHDFRANGLLLPGSDSAALRFGLPLHCGPHRAYNAMVMERVGQIERYWSRTRWNRPRDARHEAIFRLRLLQRGLRRRLLDPVRAPLALNRRQLVSPRCDFADLDAMADFLWAGSEPLQALDGVSRRASSSLAS